MTFLGFQEYHYHCHPHCGFLVAQRHRELTKFHMIGGIQINAGCQSPLNAGYFGMQCINSVGLCLALIQLIPIAGILQLFLD